MFLKTYKTILISAFLSCVISLALNFIPLVFIYSKFWYASTAFHVFISLLAHLLLFRKAGDPRDYTFKIMFSSMGRLLLCMIGLLIYKICDKQNFTQFALHFMLHYILFTVFEIAYLLKFIKIQKND